LIVKSSFIFLHCHSCERNTCVVFRVIYIIDFNFILALVQVEVSLHHVVLSDPIEIKVGLVELLKLGLTFEGNVSSHFDIIMGNIHLAFVVSVFDHNVFVESEVHLRFLIELRPSVKLRSAINLGSSVVERFIVVVLHMGLLPLELVFKLVVTHVVGVLRSAINLRRRRRLNWRLLRTFARLDIFTIILIHLCF